MKSWDTLALADYHDEGPNASLLHEDANVRMLLISFKAGQKVDPCVMERDVVFCSVRGKATIWAEGKAIALRPGVVVTVPRGVERTIGAEDDSLVVAVQTK